MALSDALATMRPAAPTMGGNPLVKRANLKQLDELKQRQQQALPEVDSFADEASMPRLVQHVRKAWQRNKDAKLRVERRLLACLRARKGVYSAEEIAIKQQGGGVNLVWYDLTETKCRGASAWIRDIVLPSSGEKPWGLMPTAKPDLPLPFKQAIVSKAIAEALQVLEQIHAAGGGVMEQDEYRQLVAELGEKHKAEAVSKLKKGGEVKAKAMERQIEDRLDEGDFSTAMDAFVEEFVTYPTAFMKGPIFKRTKTLAWVGDGYTPKVVNEPKQCFEHRSAFDIYPSPGASSLQSGDLIDHERYERGELYDLIGLPGYQDDQIRAALEDYSAGHLEHWMWTQGERERLMSETMHQWLSPHNVIDAVNYWGSVQGSMLKEFDVPGAGELDDVGEYEVNIVLVGRYVIFAGLNPHPLGHRPYRSASYDSIPGSIWGRAIPELAETSQRMCNVHACAIADNVSMASGPMVWIYGDMLADGEQSLDIIPWKVWQLKAKPGQTSANPGIGFFQAEDRSNVHMANLDKWEVKCDDTTGIPRYTYGNERVGGAGNTASGLSMLLNNAAKGLRRAISAIDAGIFQTVIGDVFVNEMLYNPDTSIKGDAIVVPKGAAAILIKDTAQMRRTQFLGMTANPIDMDIIRARGRATLLRETVQSLELPEGIVPTDEEMVKREQDAQQQAQAQMQAQQEMQAQQQQGELQAEERRMQLQQAAKNDDRLQGLITDVVKQQVQARAGGSGVSDRERPRGPVQNAGLGRALATA